MNTRAIVTALFAVLTALGALAASGAEYPARSIRLIVPFVPGGGTDLLARLLTPRLTDVLGQQVVVDNRGGAGSVIGTEIIAKAAADGYTLGFMDTAFAINPAISTSLTYNAERDFVFLNIVATSPTVLVVRSSLPVKSLNELIALAKGNPGKLTFGSAGANSSAHLTGEMLNTAAGISIRHVPFKGAGAAIIDVVGGHIDVTFLVPGTAAPHVKSGAIRALAASGTKRTVTLPDVPTFESLGFPSVNPGNFRFLIGPAGMPGAVQKRLVAAMEKLAQMPDLAARLTDNGYDPAFIGPPGAREYVLTEIQKWRKVTQDPALKVK